MALKSQNGVIMFQANVPPHIFFGENGLVEKKMYLSSWKTLAEVSVVQIESRMYSSTKDIRARLEANNVFYLAYSFFQDDNVHVLFLSCQYNNATVLVDLRTQGESATLCCKSDNAAAVGFVSAGIQHLITTQ
jgi:hypothetical protein